MPVWLRQEKEQWTPSTATFRRYAGLVLKAALLGLFLCQGVFVLRG